MKTLTEFPSPTLKNAAKTKQELIAGGKTPEELPQAMGEALKLEGDKLTRLVDALAMVEKRLNDLKRVVVLQIGEGEKAPKGAEVKGELVFIAEYYPPLPGQAPRGPRGERHDRGRGGRDDKKGRGKGRGRRDDRGRDRGRSGEQKPGEAQAGAPSGTAGGADRRPRRPRNPNAPRGPRPEGRPGQEPSESQTGVQAAASVAEGQQAGTPKAGEAGEQRRRRRRRRRGPKPGAPQGAPEQAARATEGTAPGSEAPQIPQTPPMVDQFLGQKKPPIILKSKLQTAEAPSQTAAPEPAPSKPENATENADTTE